MRSLDCVIAGSCVVDLLCRPVALDRPIGHGVLHQVEPIQLVAGGITSNAGVTLARLGLKVGVLSYVGDDAWASVIRNLYRSEGIDDRTLMTHPTEATSTTVVAIEPGGERSFFHCVGAPRQLNAKVMLDQLDMFSRTKFLLLGYYSLMPNLEADLATVMREIRATGCKTAMDAAGQGGGMKPLADILPHLDAWVPSLAEAKHQTGHEDPQKIIETYRNCGAPGLLGVKLGGKRGVLLSPAADEFVPIASCTPPGPVVDTTGAGDSFYAGLLAGLIRGMATGDAGRLGAATAACCVTSLGGATGGRDWKQTCAIANLPTEE